MNKKQLGFTGYCLLIGMLSILILGMSACSAKTSSAAPFQPSSVSETTSNPPAPTLSSVSVTGNQNGNLAVGSSTQFTAVGTYSDGSSANINSMVSWNSSNSGIASIGSNGSATGLTAGTTNITASASGVYSSPVALTVSQSFGPTSFNIGTTSGNFSIPTVSAGDTVNFQFTAAGSLVYYSVLDPNNNIILTGDGGNKVASGQGTFIASSSGTYTINFKSSGIVTPSVMTVNGSIY